MTAITVTYSTTKGCQLVERLKEDGLYREAGRTARQYGLQGTYGCHYGMRSTRDTAATEFLAGFAEGPAQTEWGVVETKGGFEVHRNGRPVKVLNDTYATVEGAKADIERRIKAEETIAINRRADDFRRELGRVIGTDADPAFWARHFNCTVEAAQQTIRSLRKDGHAVIRDGLLYAL